MKITESKLRQMIRGVIREFTPATAIGRGTKLKPGTKSAAAKSAVSKEKLANTAYK